jgi:predicted lipase
LERENITLSKVKKNIIFCGHSLGGSCVISALEIALLDKVYCPVKVISFGSPRIGNREFEDWVDKIIPCNLRVVN